MFKTKELIRFSEVDNGVLRRSWNICKAAQASKKRNIKYQNQYFASPKP
jgi:hypothetical protein